MSLLMLMSKKMAAEIIFRNKMMIIQNNDIPLPPISRDDGRFLSGRFYECNYKTKCFPIDGKRSHASLFGDAFSAVSISHNM